jgi:hypothetical protein
MAMAVAGGQPEIDPIIRGLLARLPKSGEAWPESERKLWLELLEDKDKPDKEARVRSNDPLMESALKKD